MTADEKVADGDFVAVIEKRTGRTLGPAERAVVAKALEAPMARIEARLAAIEKRERERIEKRRVTPELARMVLDLDESVSKMAIAKGVHSASLAVTHPAIYADLRKVAGDPLPVKKNGGVGAPRPWQGIL